MKDNQAFLQQQILDLESALLKATRLSPISESNRATGSVEPIPSGPALWGNVKRKLEDKYRKPKGENPHADAVAQHWESKVADLEQQAGLPSVDPDKFMRD